MTTPRPEFPGYVDWMRSAASVTIDQNTARHYKLNALSALTASQSHPFFRAIDNSLAAIAAEYESSTGARLLATEPRVILQTKPYESALNKSYRHNIVFNKRFPDPPTGGWLGPDRWFSTLNDIIRASIVCRYLDGPEFVAKRLHAVAEAAGLQAKYVSVQHDRGYYAFQFYVTIDAEVVDGTASVTVEIQLTTQLQDVVRELTHRFYEELRVKERTSQRNDTWKWEYKTARFKAGYLSHTLHLLEGLIAEVRGEQADGPPLEEHDDGRAEVETTDSADTAPPNDPAARPGR